MSQAVEWSGPVVVLAFPDPVPRSFPDPGPTILFSGGLADAIRAVRSLPDDRRRRTLIELSQGTILGRSLLHPNDVEALYSRSDFPQSK